MLRQMLLWASWGVGRPTYHEHSYSLDQPHSVAEIAAYRRQLTGPAPCWRQAGCR